MVITTGRIIHLRNLSKEFHNGEGMINIDMSKIESYIEIESGDYAKLEIYTTSRKYIVGCSIDDFEEKYFKYIHSNKYTY